MQTKNNPKIFNLYSSVKFIAYPVYNSNSRIYKGSQFKQILNLKCLHWSSTVSDFLRFTQYYAAWYTFIRHIYKGQTQK